MTATTFDPAQTSSHITLSGGNLVATANGIGYKVSTRGTVSVDTTEAKYWQTTITAVGTATHIGFAAVLPADGNALGAVLAAWGYQSDGTVLNNGVSVASFATFTTGDVIGVGYNRVTSTLSCYKNGAHQGDVSSVTGALYPVATVDTGGIVVANFSVTVGGFDSFDLAPPDPGDVAVTMTAMTASAARLATAAVTMEPMTSAGGFNGFGDADMAPMTVSASGGNNSGAVTMAPMTADVTGHSEHRADVTMEPMTAAATGYDSSINTVAKTLPAITLSSTGYAGEVITFAGTIPAITLESHTKDVRVTLPALTLSATLLSGTVITVEARIAPPILVATLVNPAIITVASSVPPIRLSASLAAGRLATAILELPKIRIAANVLTGNVATVLASIPAPTMAAAGYPAYTITFAGTLPAVRLTATLSAAVTAAFRTWVLNTKKGALTEYGSEWAMNSYASFNGVVLGCTSSGVVALGTQALDNATAISSTVKSGKDNFGSSVIKRIPRIYLDYTTGGDAQFALITTEGGTRRYALNWNNVTGSQTRRIPVGKGPKSARWQWEYTNTNGADFDIGAVLAYPTKLRRRVQ